MTSGAHIEGTVLDGIIAGVKQDLEPRIAAAPIARVQAAAAANRPAQDVLPRLRVSGHVSVISEVKRSSPSKGHLADIPDPAYLAALYAAGGAAAISVLTEKRRFGGTLEDLDAVRAAVTIPVLRKDFVVTQYQVWEARAHGADLILLIVAALDDAELADLLQLTHELGMAALVETHDAGEVDRALAAGARILGVNARNLKTLDVDRSVFAQLKSNIPPDVIAVAESGVLSREAFLEYAEAGADAVLIGEYLATSSDPRVALEDLIFAGRAARTRDGKGR